MQEINGDIWDHHKLGRWIVITTNGDVKKGSCIMGRGTAKQAADRFPDLSKELGARLDGGNNVYIFDKYRIITLPTKHSWRDRKADLDLIERSLQQLVKWANDPQKHGKFYLVRPGCSNGRRDWESEVKPICEKYLDDRFVIVWKSE